MCCQVSCQSIEKQWLVMYIVQCPLHLHWLYKTRDLQPMITDIAVPCSSLQAMQHVSKYVIHTVHPVVPLRELKGTQLTSMHVFSVINNVRNRKCCNVNKLLVVQRRVSDSLESLQQTAVGNVCYPSYLLHVVITYCWQSIRASVH